MTSPHTPIAKLSGSLWNLGGLTLSQLSRRVLDEVVANNVVGHATELAFFFLFALFPLILIVVTSFGRNHRGFGWKRWSRCWLTKSSSYLIWVGQSISA